MRKYLIPVSGPQTNINPIQIITTLRAVFLNALPPDTNISNPITNPSIPIIEPKALMNSNPSITLAKYE